MFIGEPRREFPELARRVPSESRGSVILGGQILSLLLTLIGTPVAYSIFDDWAESRLFARIKSRLSRRGARADDTAVVAAPAPVAD